MKLSEILGWPEKKEILDTFYGDCEQAYYAGFNEALTSCDREIDREALAKYLENYFDNHEFADMTFCSGSLADDLIKSMPTWLKRIER